MSLQVWILVMKFFVGKPTQIIQERSYVLRTGSRIGVCFSKCFVNAQLVPRKKVIISKTTFN